MELPNPIPRTFREAVWQILFAMVLATRVRGVTGFFHRAWSALRESSAKARISAAEAHKTDAEAEEIEARTAIGTAALIREMSVSMGQAELLRERLKGEMASKDSIIELQKAEIAELKSGHQSEKKTNGCGPNPAA